MKKLIAFSLSFFPLFLLGQLQGTVTDTDGSPLPFVNIYIANTSIGTTTNPEGYYELALKPGSYSINYQFVGYELVTQEVQLSAAEQSLDIKMSPENYQLQEITIKADAEDPAYAIIRKAQAKRKYYKKLYSNYSCDAYMRGFNKVNSAPEKIFGMEIGDMDGALDSTRSGVVYLSESVSKLYAVDGQSKEILYSSKVSGDDQGYSYNSAQEMDFNLYNNTVEFNKEVVSPIAFNALSHYKYKLEGASIDNNGQLVNKIKVIQKNELGNSFYGYIYINENLWNFHSIDLNLSKHATQVPILDTVNIKQVFAPLTDDHWVLLSNYINFKMGILGVEFQGNFTSVYSNYELGQVSKDIIDKVSFKLEEEANTRTDLYWDSIRPIPLTLEEELDYKRKDSIRIVRESPEYLDSIDQEANKFKVRSLLFGYTHQNSRKQSKLSFSSPLSRLRLNTVQGLSLGSALTFSKILDKQKEKEYNLTLDADYGLSEKVFRPYLEFDFINDRVNNFTIKAEGGRKLSQYSRTNPITPRVNSVFTYLFRENYMKLYDKAYASLYLSRDLLTGLTGSISVNYEDRTAVTNNYFGGLKQDSKDFSSNNPERPLDESTAFSDHQALILRANLVINLGQKLWLYPNRTYKENSSWPTLSLHYKGGIPQLGSDVDYHLLYSQLYKDWELSIYGTLNLNLMVGSFVGDNKPEYFIDHLHFNGNQTHIGYPPNYGFTFMNKPYFLNSTDDSFINFHVQHQFDGYLLDKLPFIKKLGWEFVVGYKYLNSESVYQELHLGLDNIGFKAFRFFRADLVFSNPGCPEGFDCAPIWTPAVVIGTKVKL